MQASLLLLNWSAPAAISVKAQEQQALAFGQYVSRSTDNFGVLFCPVFHYKKHQMHMLEHVLLKSLTGRGVDVDQQAMLLYKARSDQRDARPLAYPLRLVKSLVHSAAHEDEGSEDSTSRPAAKRRKSLARSLPGMAGFWSRTALSTSGRTQEAEQVPNAKLKAPEDLSEVALPSTTNEAATNHVKGGKRYEQIGVDAGCKLLESLLETEDKLPDGFSGVMIIDLNMGVGDVFHAWLQRVKATNYNLFYVGTSSNSMETEWINHVIAEQVTADVLAGNVSLPGFQAKALEPPADLLAGAPALPALNLCTVKKLSLVVPEATVKAWVTHEKFGTEFQDKLKSIVEEFGQPEESLGQDQDSAATGEPSPKKAKTLSHTVAVADLCGTKIAEAVVTGLKKDLAGKVMLRIGTDQSWLLMNKSTAAITLARGTVIAGFGLGAFQHLPRDGNGKPAELPEQQKLILFDLKDSASLIMLGAKLTTVGAAVTGMQATRPNAEVCYHKMISEGTGFKLERKHEVYYKCTGKVQGQVDSTAEDAVNVDLKGTNAFGGLVNPQGLQFEHCNVIWHVKWATKGLMPVKPAIVLVNTIEIPADTAAKV